MICRVDYNRKAEDAVDYEDIDEEYDGPEVQVVSEEDHLLSKKEYLSNKVALNSLNSRASVFDDEDYDEEEEEQEQEEHMPVEKAFDIQPGLYFEISVSWTKRLAHCTVYFCCVISLLSNMFR